MIKKKVRLNIRKCDFLCEIATWCGRDIKAGKWKFNEGYFNKILQVPKPRYRDELMQAFYMAQWLSPSLPQLSVFRSAFSEMLNLGGKKIRQIKRMNTVIEWTPELDATWKSFLAALYSASRTFLQAYDPREGVGVLLGTRRLCWGFISLMWKVSK